MQTVRIYNPFTTQCVKDGNWVKFQDTFPPMNIIARNSLGLVASIKAQVRDSILDKT